LPKIFAIILDIKHILFIIIIILLLSLLLMIGSWVKTGYEKNFINYLSEYEK
jgi:hypothetical protein